MKKHSIIKREFINLDFVSTAVFSSCFNFRYSLTRIWDNGGAKLLFILLNPSKATEKLSDPTLARCQTRALLLGYKQFRICNLFAFRSTSPKILKTTPHIKGSHNDKIIRKSILWADSIICSWGSLGTFQNRSSEVLKLLKKSNKSVYHLGLTKNRQPKHLLYISFNVSPKKWL